MSSTVVPKLSPAQVKLLQTFASGRTAWRSRHLFTQEIGWMFYMIDEKINVATAESLLKRGLIETYHPAGSTFPASDGMKDCRISDAGRAALEAANGVQNLNATVTVYAQPVQPEANFRPFSRTLREAMFSLQQKEQINPVSAYVEVDTVQQRVNEVVEHTEAGNGVICLGDWVRVETSNPHCPFEGKVEKLIYGGFVRVRFGSITYKAKVERVTVLATAAQREEAFASTAVEANAS